MTSVRFVVDNSVVMAWCFKDEVDKYTDAVLATLQDGEAFVPSIWPLEVGNVLLVAERKGRLTKADVVRFIELVSGLPISVEHEDPKSMLNDVIALARDFQLSTYDASYLGLAMRMGIPLATQDKALAQAARRCGVRIFGKQ